MLHCHRHLATHAACVEHFIYPLTNLWPVKRFSIVAVFSEHSRSNTVWTDAGLYNVPTTEIHLCIMSVNNNGRSNCDKLKLFWTCLNNQRQHVIINNLIPLEATAYASTRTGRAVSTQSAANKVYQKQEGRPEQTSGPVTLVVMCTS